MILYLSYQLLSIIPTYGSISEKLQLTETQNTIA